MKLLRIAVAMPFVLIGLMLFTLSAFSLFVVDHILGRNVSSGLFNW